MCSKNSVSKTREKKRRKYSYRLSIYIYVCIEKTKFFKNYTQPTTDMIYMIYIDTLKNFISSNIYYNYRYE